MRTPPPRTARPLPAWLVEWPWTDVDFGVIKSGKEAQVNLIERTGADGDRCLLARKRYLPREVKTKGELDALGVQRASTFVNDARYREGRERLDARDRKAVEQKSRRGRQLLHASWSGQEYEIMTQLWNAGVSVPYPVESGDNTFDMEYVGDVEQAAPQLFAARLAKPELADAFDQLVDGLQRLTAQGLAHGDLSAYNLLWWHDTLWFIDFPQTVHLAANLQGLEFLHRDVVNICTWFNRKGLNVEADQVFAELLSFT